MAPRLFVIGRSTFDVEHLQSFLESEAQTWNETDATSAEKIVEIAGRICYMSFGADQSDKTNGKYIRHLIDQGHESVLEHVSWTFIVTGISRSFSHQLVRHRVGFSYSQLSQQYHVETEAVILEPSIIARDVALSEMWHRSVQNSQQSYREILAALEDRPELFKNGGRREELRRIRSAARSVLPGGIETKIVVTANARAIRHFLKIRGNIIGDEEMRIVSALLLETVSQDAPSMFADFRVSKLEDGSPIVEHMDIKVSE
jgi:thymidylate synthase (FAD)